MCIRDSDQTDGSFRSQLNSLVEFLSQHHRLLNRETQLSRGFLLKFRSDEGWNRVSFPLFRRHFCHNELLVSRLGNNTFGALFIFDQYFVLLDVLIKTTCLYRLLLDFEEPGIKRRWNLCPEAVSYTHLTL